MNMTRNLFIMMLLLVLSITSFADDTDNLIAKLSDSDRKEIINLRQEIAILPQSVKEEIKSYQDFVTMLDGQINKKYASLSIAAKTALKQEEDIIAKLSPHARTSLEDIVNQQ
jgi:dGTP triphosphohydrolase